MTAPQVHASAIVAEGAVLGAGTHVGPYCTVGPRVRLGDGVVLRSHVVVDGDTDVGAGTEIFPFASIGGVPQDLKFRGEASRLIIGARNTIRESCTMNPGTEGGGLETIIGNDNLFMVNVHVAHDCRIGDHCVLVNNVSLAGHVIVENNAIIGGHSGVHQFVRIGQGAMVGMLSAVASDVIPFGTVTGENAKLSGLNLVGLKRRNVDKTQINELRAAYKALFWGEGTLKDRARDLAQTDSANPLIAHVTDFILSESDRAFCRPDND